MHRGIVIALVSVGAAAYMSGSVLAASDGEPSKPTPRPKAAVTKVVKTVAPSPKQYIVQAGDNLSGIAATEQLATWQPLWDANPSLNDPDLIYPGQNLVVPTAPTTPRPLPAGYDVADTVAATMAPASAPVTQSTVSAGVNRPAANYAAGVGGILARVRQRESGGNYATNTGNGYYGAYQFSLGTWESVGGHGLPSDASAAEQDMRAQMLYSERGCAPWPNTCY